MLPQPVASPAVPPASLLLQAAELAAGGQQYPKGTLYIVATPIGNLADLSLRAVHVLALVDTVACEDSRVAGGLLRHLGLHKPLLAVHEHNEAEAAVAVVERLARGERVAYASDAGTPAVSDPGARLVAAVVAAGARVVPIPGSSSVAAALSVAGDAAGTQFRFGGFAPAKGAARSDTLRQWAGEPHTLVVFEAPHRIAGLLTDLAQMCPQRRITLCRELTKQFETVVAAAAAQLPTWLAQDSQRSRGEFVLVLHAQDIGTIEPAWPPGTEELLQALLTSLPLKQAVTLLAQATGLPRNALYERALALKQAAAPDEAGGAAGP